MHKHLHAAVNVLVVYNVRRRRMWLEPRNVTCLLDEAAMIDPTQQETPPRLVQDVSSIA